MARYVDGYVVPIEKKNIARYKQLATKASKVWLDHGALDYCECVGEDLEPEGLQNSFPKMTKCRPGETVVFSWIVYKSRAHRDRVNKKVMADPRLADMMSGKDNGSPMDHKRMAYAGFDVLVDPSTKETKATKK